MIPIQPKSGLALKVKVETLSPKVNLRGPAFGSPVRRKAGPIFRDGLFKFRHRPKTIIRRIVVLFLVGAYGRSRKILHMPSTLSKHHEL